jgi:hypothetical protein
MLWDECRHADSQVHVEAILELLCCASRDPVADIQDGGLMFSLAIRRGLSKSRKFYLLLRGGLHNAIDIDAR